MTSTPTMRRRVDQLMLDVSLALLPGIAVTVLLFGWLPLRNLILAAAAALLLETMMLRARGKRQARIYGDGSALLSGVLLALCLPAFIPWPLLLLGATIAIGCKQLYGGLGQNPFNPAMAAFVSLLVLFPAAINSWPVAAWPWSPKIDAVSSATALELLRTQLNLNHTLSEISPALSSTFSARAALACAWLAGGLYLLWRGTIRWQIPLAVIAGLAAPAALFWLVDTEHHASPLSR
jgi:electron transport complex protein RnfD